MASEHLHRRILIGVLLGAGAGVLANLLFAGDPWLTGFIRYVTQPAGQIFLRLLLMLVIPLVFAGLVNGVAGLGDMRHLGRVGLKTLAFTLLFSALAVLLGLTIVNLLQPGAGVATAVREQLLAGAAERAGSISIASRPDTGWNLLLAIVPDNPVRAAANGDMIAVMFFALMLGIGLTLTHTEAARRFAGAIEGLYDVTMRLIAMVISLAPLGVAALLFTLTAQLGYSVLLQLGSYALVVILALAIHQFIVYSLALKWYAGISPRAFFRNVQSAMLTAFSTASSSATLPTSLQVANDKLRLPPQVARFVLTIGATANQNGTALFEGITVLFLAQFYGVPLSLGEQGLVLFICVLGGIGTAGVPAGSLPVVAMILGMVGIPAEGIGLILGVDRLLDMCRTTVNVTGDLVIATLVARGEPRVTS
jgi:DAACS family dicarboxylate/amino acid:cation (Na+ or H+) symporter